MGRETSRIRPEAIQLVAASLALLGGLLLYLLTRPQVVMFAFMQGPGTAAFPLENAVFYSLPSFLHAYAFILLTNLVINSSANGLRVICIVWIVIELLFEVGQHPDAVLMAGYYLPEWFQHLFGWDVVTGYFVFGHFDVMDMAFVLLGAYAAYLTVLISRREAVE